MVHAQRLYKDKPLLFVSLSSDASVYNNAYEDLRAYLAEFNNQNSEYLVSQGSLQNMTVNKIDNFQDEKPSEDTQVERKFYKANYMITAVYKATKRSQPVQGGE